MKVFVVMSNDFPDGVFDNIESAERYAENRKNEPGNKHEHGRGYRIYWRVYEFELRSDVERAVA